MEYTKSKEKEGTVWSLSEFINLHGNYSAIKVVGTTISSLYGVFNDGGIHTYVHIERKIRMTSIHYILSNLEEYEVVATVQEYCLHKKGEIIDYNTIYKDLYPYEQEEEYFDRLGYYMDNPDVFGIK